MLIYPFLARRNKNKSVLYLAAFFPGNAGYHWRVKKWTEELEKEGFTVNIASPLNELDFKHLLAQDHHQFLIKSLKRRFWQVVASRKHETVIVRRELLIFNDYGNLFLEKLLLKIHPNAILDFDDDLSAAKKQPKKIANLFGRLMRENGDKFNESLQLYQHFIVASDYLKNRVLNQNKCISDSAICIIPTCVDYDKFAPKEYANNEKLITFGWIGGDYNYPLLEPVFKVLDELAEHYSFRFLVIGGKPIQRITKFTLDFVPWSLDSEISDLKKIDVGVMPLIDDEESRGKGGFKLLQYMGLGIASIASPITINKDIIGDESNGLFALTEEEWKIAFVKCLNGEIVLKKVGENGRKRIESSYTFNANKVNYIEFINRVRNSGNLV
jgi:glycosyltransferase involved in cell wall biosynthesis